MTRVKAIAFSSLVAASALALLGSASLGGCSDDQKQAPAPTFDSKIVFGMVASLSGNHESFGDALKQGTRTAEMVLNSAGGILGKQVYFDIRDDFSDPQPRLEGVMRELLAENIVAMMGPASSVQCTNTAGLCFGRIPQISAWATSTALTDISGGSAGASRWFFRTVPSDVLQARALFKVATSPKNAASPTLDGGAPDYRCKKPHILYNEDAIGIPGGLALEAAFAKVHIPTTKKSTPGKYKADYKDEIEDIITKQPDCVIFWTYAEHATVFLNDLHARRTQGTDPLPSDLLLLFNDGPYDKMVIENTSVAGPSSANGIHGTAPDTAPKRPGYDRFVTHYHNYVGDPEAVPPSFSANAFDAAVVIALAVQKAGRTDGVAVRDALFALSHGTDQYKVDQIGDAILALRKGVDVNYSGATGEVDFDDHGNVETGYIEWAVENGVFVTKRQFTVEQLQQ